MRGSGNQGGERGHIQWCAGGMLGLGGAEGRGLRFIARVDFQGINTPIMAAVKLPI